MEEKEKSLKDLMDKAFSLSLDLAHSELAPDGHYFTPRNLPISQEKNDLIFGWADGLVHNYYERICSGRTSIQAQVDFDIEKFEETINKDIKQMEDLLVIYGKPIKITFDEMKKRGYRGSWAGYTKDEDRLFHLSESKKNLEIQKNLLSKTKDWNEIQGINDNILYYELDIKRLEKQNP